MITVASRGSDLVAREHRGRAVQAEELKPLLQRRIWRETSECPGDEVHHQGFSCLRVPCAVRHDGA